MPKRIQLSRAKGYRKPEGAIVVARPTRWGNPYSVEDFGLRLALTLFESTAKGIFDPTPVDHLSTSEFECVYLLHCRWTKRIDGHPIEAARHELAGHDLACWCPLDRACHADVLLEIANAEVSP